MLGVKNGKEIKKTAEKHDEPKTVIFLEIKKATCFSFYSLSLS